jgi:hypothetical protein
MNFYSGMLQCIFLKYIGFNFSVLGQEEKLNFITLLITCNSRFAKNRGGT